MGEKSKYGHPWELGQMYLVSFIDNLEEWEDICIAVEAKGDSEGDRQYQVIWSSQKDYPVPNKVCYPLPLTKVSGTKWKFKKITKSEADRRMLIEAI